MFGNALTRMAPRVQAAAQVILALSPIDKRGQDNIRCVFRSDTPRSMGPEQLGGIAVRAEEWRTEVRNECGATGSRGDDLEEAGLLSVPPLSLLRQRLRSAGKKPSIQSRVAGTGGRPVRLSGGARHPRSSRRR